MMKNLPVSNAILKRLKQANLNYRRVFREPRKTDKFIDGHSLKFYAVRAITKEQRSVIKELEKEFNVKCYFLHRKLYGIYQTPPSLVFVNA